MPPEPRFAFQRLTIAHAASAAGDAVVAVALAGTLFFGVSVSQARPRVALYLLLTMAPFALLAPLIGPAIDRRRGGRRLAIVVAAAGRAGLALLMAGLDDSLLLYPAAFGVLVLSRAHGVARSALVPATLSPERRLVDANARLAKVAVVSSLAFGVPAVALDRLIGPGAVLVLAAGLFGLTAIAGAALPRPAAGESVLDGDASVPERVRLAFVAGAAIRALGGFLLFVLAFGLRARGVGSAGFGLVLAMTGAGSFLGATLVPRLRRGGNEEWVLAVSLLAGGGASLIASRQFGLDLAVALGTVVGALSSAGRLAFDSLVQRDAPGAARGRTFARFETISQIWWVAGATLPVVIPIPIVAGLVVACVGFFAAAVWYLVALGAGGRRRLSG